MGYLTFTGKCCTGFVHKHICFFAHSHFIYNSIFASTLLAFSWFPPPHDLSHWFYFSFIPSCMLLFALACSIQPTFILKGLRRKRYHCLHWVRWPVRGSSPGSPKWKGADPDLGWEALLCLILHKKACHCYNLCCFCSFLSDVLCGCCFSYWKYTGPHHLPTAFCVYRSFSV